MLMQASARLWRTNLVDWRAGFSTTMGPGMVYLESLRNHEREGVPSGAGTDTSEGFDLVRCRLYAVSMCMCARTGHLYLHL